MNMHDEAEHDAWLREALRHAPDADAGPPAALSARILQRANAAVAAVPAAAAPAGWLARGLAAWSWLARPPVAAGFASVMLATVVGLMWWDRPLEEALPQREAATAAAPAADPLPAPTPTPTPAPVTESAREAASVSPAPASPAAVLSTPPSSVSRADVAGKSTSAAPAPTAAQRQTATAAVGSPKAAAMPMQAPSPAPTPATVPSPSQDAATEPPPAEMTRKAAEGRAEDRSARRIAPESERMAQNEASTLARSRMAGPAAAPAAAAAPSALVGSATPPPAPLTQQTPLTALLAAMRSEPQRWSWQRGESSARALSPALLQWLAQLDNATGARWVPPAAGGSSGPAGGVAELRLWRDGQLHSVLRLSELGVQLERLAASTATTASAWHAKLDSDTDAALRAGLEQATR
jgi:hypothetical protein